MLNNQVQINMHFDNKSTSLIINTSATISYIKQLASNKYKLDFNKTEVAIAKVILNNDKKEIKTFIKDENKSLDIDIIYKKDYSFYLTSSPKKNSNNNNSNSNSINEYKSHQSYSVNKKINNNMNTPTNQTISNINLLKSSYSCKESLSNRKITIKKVENKVKIKIENFVNQSEILNDIEDKLKTLNIEKSKYSFDLSCLSISYIFDEFKDAYNIYEYLSSLKKGLVDDKEKNYKFINIYLYFGKNNIKEHVYNVNKKLLKNNNNNNNTNTINNKDSANIKCLIKNASNKHIKEGISDNNNKQQKVNKKISNNIDKDNKNSKNNYNKNSNDKLSKSSNIKTDKYTSDIIEKNKTISPIKEKSILKKNILLNLDYKSNINHNPVKIRELMLKKQQEVLDLICPSLHRITSPYISEEEQRLHNENKNKEKFVGKNGVGFNSATSLYAARKLPCISNYVGATPSAIPPLNYQFRDTDKSHWINKKGFKIC